tara:strand:- start:432 stop:536 length:105 start_codon:yes stop_codon:yes gene_type:complete
MKENQLQQMQRLGRRLIQLELLVDYLVQLELVEE